jgi:polyisoprenoid-binding protein YceI
MSKATRALLLLAGLLLVAAPAFAQTVYRIQPESSKVSIDGTSNKSPEWTVYANEFSGHVKMNPTETDPGVEEARLTVVSKAIKSNRSGIMDRLAHRALKANQHPEIVYELTSVESVEVDQDDPNAFVLNARGNLTLAGVTKAVDMLVEGTRLDDGLMRFAGSHTLLMSDYGIERPTAMFGALVTGDEVTVHAELVAAPEVAGSR